MVSIKTRELSRMGKRRFLKTLATFGIGGTTLNYITQETLAEKIDDLSEEVPVVKYLAASHPDAVEEERDATGRAPVYMTVPRNNWLRHRARQRMIDGASRLLESKLDRTDNVGLGSKVVTSGHRKTSVLQAVVMSHGPVSAEEVREALPDRMTAGASDGAGSKQFTTDVIVKSGRVKNQAYYNYEYDQIPAGVQIQSHRPGDGYGKGTLCSPAMDLDTGNPVFVSAGHNFKDGQYGDLSDKVVYQHIDPVWDQGQRTNDVGPPTTAIDEAYDFFDAGYFEADDKSDDPATFQIAADAESTYDWTVDGIVTQLTLNYWADNGTTENVYIQGRKSGRNQGEITGYHDDNNDDATDGNGNVQSEWAQIETDFTGTQPGDSGGPYFDVDGDYAYIVACHQGVYDRDNDGTYEATGTAAESIEWEFNLQFHQ